MLHLPTLISLCFILNLFIAVFFFSVYSYKKQPSFLFFATACCSFITAIALIGLRGVIDYPLLTYFFAYLFIILTPLLLILGLIPQSTVPAVKLTPLYYACAICCTLLLAVYLIDAGQIITSIITAVLFCYAAYLMIKTPSVAKVQQRLLIACFSLHSVVMLLQVVLLVLPYFSQISQANLAAGLQLLLVSHLFLTTASALILPFIAFANEESKLINLANHDPLTQLLNRRGFFRLCKKITHTVPLNSRVSLIMLDIDLFKQVNDRYGHETGDEAIKWIAQHINELFFEAGITARIGGEEFAIFLNQKNLTQARQLAQKLCRSIDQYPFYFNGNSIALSVSAGVSSALIRDLNMQELLLQADKRLYLAKETGRNKVVTHDEKSALMNSPSAII
ncbi:GGDEF domain-containing protein [Pseudoalteromonas sp. MER144-MNA-CIBAN-0113]|uniref:GGDEF domain-containing protein n=2 Tax=unclassified Pseudoalteromonas TaxID=194690 RepID=UPI003332B3BD